MTNIISSLNSPYFVSSVGTTLNNVTGDGTIYSTVYNTLQQGSSSWFNTSNGIFTATQGGRYNFSVFVDFGGIAAQTVCIVSLVTSTKTYIISKFSPSGIKGPASAAMASGSIISVNMSLNNTAFVTLQVSGGSKSISFNNASYFMGRRIS